MSVNAVTALSIIHLYQEAFLTINSLRLTDFKYPPQAVVNDGEKYDYIVVGAGTAGSVVATRLAAIATNKVLVVEAGDNPTIQSTLPGLVILTEKSHADWNFKYEVDNTNRKCSKRHKTAIQGKSLGGTSNLNYLLYDEGSYKDYNTWAHIVNDSSWNFKNLQPYIKKSKNIDFEISNSSERANYDEGGPITITKENHYLVKDYLDAFSKLGYKVVSQLNAKEPEGLAPQLFTIGNYRRQSTAEAYLTKTKNWQNLHILRNATVIKIVFNNDKNAVAVKINYQNKIITVRARKEIIICAGSFNSPKLLMLSGIGPKEHLKSLNIKVIKDLPVGKNLQDRAGVLVIHDMKRLTTSPVSANPGVFPAYAFSGQVVENHHCSNQRLQSYVNLPMNLEPYCVFTYDYCNKICDSLFVHRKNNQFLWTFISNTKPKSRGEVLLKSSDYSESPKIDPKYLSHENDVKMLIKRIKSYLKINETEFFKSADAVWLIPNLKPCKDLEVGSEKYFECYIQCMKTAERSYCGTCAMGSVVNSRLKVIGVNKLRVVDSSVIPEITSSGTLGPTVTIAERAADMIKEDNSDMGKERNISNGKETKDVFLT